jgi:hypothetical protein
MVLTLKTSVPDPDQPDPHFLVLLDPDPLVRSMDPDPSIIKQKEEKPCSFGLFIFEYDVNVPSKSNKQKSFFFNLFFVGVLKVNDENSRIRVRIRIN